SGDLIVNNINGANLSSITVTGSGALSLNASSGATLDASVLDVSSYSGVITINDAAGAETITGTNDTNIINVSGGADIVHGGSGTDTLNINTTDTLNTIDGVEHIVVNETNNLTGKVDATVTDITIAGGKTLTAQSSDVDNLTITDGANTAHMTVTANADVNLSSTDIAGTLTINDDTGSHTITGSANSDILNLNSGDDTVNLGDGDDTINVDIANLDINDNITDTNGTDNVTFNDSGTIDSADIIDFSGIETLNMHSGDDTVTFDDVTEFNNFRDELNVVDSGGTDTLQFGSTSVSGDLDFANLDEFENLELSSTADDITLSGDEPDNINASGGDDTLTLDFSNVSSFTTLDGAGGADEVELTGTFAANNADFGSTGDYDNIETLDISAMTGTNNAEDEVIFTDALLDDWNGTGTDFTLQLDSSQAENIKFETQDGTIYDGSGTDDHNNNIADGVEYDLGNTTLTIDFTDV
ncbi:MAG: hypothetical protein U9Q04_04170, partial [Campylobacterota bacterium]|nr:hypothetical protein [Campylobacterota bacterium]